MRYPRSGLFSKYSRAAGARQPSRSVREVHRASWILNPICLPRHSTYCRRTGSGILAEVAAIDLTSSFARSVLPAQSRILCVAETQWLQLDIAIRAKPSRPDPVIHTMVDCGGPGAREGTRPGRSTSDGCVVAVSGGPTNWPFLRMESAIDATKTGRRVTQKE